MKNVSEYDERQLILMLEHLNFFENKQIDLISLVGSLEFLLNVLETADEDWEEKFLKEITTLETINALEIIKESGEQIPGIQNDKKKTLIKNSIDRLKKLIDSTEIDDGCGCTQHGHPGWYYAPLDCVCICGRNGIGAAEGSYRSKVGSD